MPLKTTDGLTILKFGNLNSFANLAHGASGRTGGVSDPPFATLNVSHAVGDERERVLANRNALCAALDVSPDGVVCAQQVHGARVARVGHRDRGRGYSDRSTAIPETDALVTNEAGVFLWLTFADCVPVVFFDPARRAVGIAHAGWRGTVEHIAARTVEAMHREFGTRPADLLVGVGPAIGGCCYQVGTDVAEALRAAFPKHPNVLAPDGPGHFRADLPLASARLLADIGVPSEQIEVSDFCTACRTDLFYSHRAEGGRTGRMAAIIGIRV